MAVGTADKGLLKTVGEGFQGAVGAAAYPGDSSRVLKDVLRVVSTTGRFFVFLTDSTIASVLKINETCGNALKIFTLVELVESVKQWTCDNPIEKGWKSATSSACKGVGRVIKVINLGDSWKFYDLGWLNNPLSRNVKVEGLLTWNRLPIAIFDLGFAVFGLASELETRAKINKNQKRMEGKREDLMKRACEMTCQKEGKNKTYKVESFKLNDFRDLAKKKVEEKQKKSSDILKLIADQAGKAKNKENLETETEKAFNRAKEDVKNMASKEALLPADWKLLLQHIATIEKYAKGEFKLDNSKNADVLKKLQTEYVKQVRLLNKWAALAASDKGDEVQKFLVEKVKRKDEQILRTERAKLQSDLMQVLYGAITTLQVLSLFASSNLMAIDPTGQTTLSIFHFSFQMLCCATALAKDYIGKYFPDKAEEVKHVEVNAYVRPKQDESLIQELVEALFKAEGQQEDIAIAMAKTYQEQAHHKKPAKESEKDFIKRMAKQLAGDIKLKAQTAGYKAEDVAKGVWETVQV